MLKLVCIGKSLAGWLSDQSPSSCSNEGQLAQFHFMTLDSAAYLALVNGPLNMIPSLNCVGEDMRKNNSATLLRNLSICLYCQ